MKVLKDKIFRTVATFLAACGVSTYFTACYGMPPFVCAYGMIPNTNLKFHVSGDIDGDGTKENVQGIRISADDNSDPVHTRSDGIAILPTYFDRGIVFTIEDVDGDANGSFKTKTYSLPDDVAFNEDINIEIELERKTESENQEE